MAVTADFTAPKHFRGRIVNERTAAVYEFNLNPNGYKQKKGSYIEEDPIPGFSNPKLGWAGGKSRVIKLTIELDAEITFRLRGAAFFNRADEDYDPNQLTIRNEIAFFEQFDYPGKPDNGGQGGDIALLTYGSAFQGDAFLVEDCDVDVTELSPDGEPTKAKVDLTLKRVVDENVFTEDVFEP